MIRLGVMNRGWQQELRPPSRLWTSAELQCSRTASEVARDLFTILETTLH